MTMDAQLMRDAGAEVQQEFPLGTWMSIPMDAAAEHSRDNIRRWSAYLSKSCIKTMIEMGWDRST